MFAEAEKQNGASRTPEARKNEIDKRKWNELLQEMAQTGLFESKGKLFEKDVDRGLELAGTLTENVNARTREYIRLGLVKLNLKFEAKEKDAWSYWDEWINGRRYKN